MRIQTEVGVKDESLISSMQDHYLYQLLNMLVKLFTVCPKILTDAKFTEDIEVIAGKIFSAMFLRIWLYCNR